MHWLKAGPSSSRASKQTRRALRQRYLQDQLAAGPCLAVQMYCLVDPKRVAWQCFRDIGRGNQPGNWERVLGPAFLYCVLPRATGLCSLFKEQVEAVCKAGGNMLRLWRMFRGSKLMAGLDAPQPGLAPLRLFLDTAPAAGCQQHDGGLCALG